LLKKKPGKVRSNNLNDPVLNVLRKKSKRQKKWKNIGMKKKEETELKKVILMARIETKTRGNKDKRKGKMKNKRMLEGN